MIMRIIFYLKQLTKFYATRNHLRLIGGGNAKEGWRILKAEHEKNIVRLIKTEGDE